MQNFLAATGGEIGFDLAELSAGALYFEVAKRRGPGRVLDEARAGIEFDSRVVEVEMIAIVDSPLHEIG